MKTLLHRIKQIEKQIGANASTGRESSKPLTQAEFIRECERLGLPPKAFLEPDWLEPDCSPEEYENRILQNEGAAALQEWKEQRAEVARICESIDPEWKAEVYRLYYGNQAHSSSP